MGRGVCLDFVLREMGTRGNLQGLRQENGRIRFSFFFFLICFLKIFGCVGSSLLRTGLL